MILSEEYSCPELKIPKSRVAIGNEFADGFRESNPEVS
jgi:hypothetical protein